MTRNKNSNLEPFDPEIERTLRRLRNLIEDKVSPKKERPTMEKQQVLGAANMAGAGNGAAVRAPRVDNCRRPILSGLLCLFFIFGPRAHLWRVSNLGLEPCPFLSLLSL